MENSMAIDGASLDITSIPPISIDAPLSMSMQMQMPVDMNMVVPDMHMDINAMLQAAMAHLQVGGCGDAQNVDVNINPTKSEVRILHEGDITAALRTRLNDNLLSCGTSRTFNSKVKSMAPGWRAVVPFERGAEEIVAWHDADPARRAVDERWNGVVDGLVERFRIR